ncbi:MAG TPA: STAS domain-containing protein [bacterium]|nr:STAS domain-containing protein [bacterium]
MANFKIDGTAVYISGDISISEGESLYNFLRGMPFFKEEVTVDMKRVESWDTSSFQTFISWMKSTEMSVKWKNIPEEMSQDLKITGLSTLFKGVQK